MLLISAGFSVFRAQVFLLKSLTVRWGWGVEGRGTCCPVLLLVSPLVDLCLYLWVTWLLRRPGKVCSVSVLNEPPDRGECKEKHTL